MAILLYRAMRSPEGGSIGVGDAAAGEAGENIPQDGTGSSASGRQGITYNTDGSINIPSDGSRYVPQAGDVIRCNDGTNYTITDVSRWDKSMFASGPIGPLPEPTCDWSLLPQPELPEMEVRHWQMKPAIIFVSAISMRHGECSTPSTTPLAITRRHGKTVPLS